MKLCFVILFFSSFLVATTTAMGEQCGKQHNNSLCRDNLCCSEYGFCGNTDAYCGVGCQSQCHKTPPPAPVNPPPPTPPSPPNPTPGGDVADIISSTDFEEMLKYRNDPRCHAVGFYTYSAFIEVARSFSGFGTTGNDTIRKREIAAFLGQTSHETTGGWKDADGGPYAWGYCYVNEVNPQWDYCVNGVWPCAPGKTYIGRGPIQLSYNYNYGPAGEAIGQDLINNPDLVSTDVTLSFKTALWFWMTAQYNKPSCHDVITGKWTPSHEDIDAGRVPGYGVITNIINGGLECGHGYDDRVEDRIGFYKRYCGILGVEPGDNLDCYHQNHF